MNQNKTIPVIAIDGPGGVGKGTVSRAVAESLGWHYLDSGALYRLAGYGVGSGHHPDATPQELGELVRGLDIRFETGPDGAELALLDGVDLSAEIRTEEAGRAASTIAAVPEVREALNEVQRRFRQPPGLVADGRDMGTVLFPDAGLKIFLGASPTERAHRRHKQLKDKGISVSLAALLTDITIRDRRDAQRTVAPLKPAFDAVCIDTTGVPVEVVVRQVLMLAGLSFGAATSA